MPKFKSLKKPLLSKEIEEELTASIRGGVYKLGDKLPTEKEMVEQLEVSRSTLREALKNLESNGLITIRRGMHAGAYVAEPNPLPIIKSFKNLIQTKKGNIFDLIEARLYIEPVVVKIAAIHRTEADIERLKDILDQAEGLVNTSFKNARVMNVHFHNELAKITQNPIMMFLCESMIEVFETLLVELTHSNLDKKAIRKPILEHRGILEAIVEKNQEEASKRTKHHLLNALHTYSKIIPEKADAYIEKCNNYFYKL